MNQRNTTKCPDQANQIVASWSEQMLPSLLNFVGLGQDMQLLGRLQISPRAKCNLTHLVPQHLAAVNLTLNSTSELSDDLSAVVSHPALTQWSPLDLSTTSNTPPLQSQTSSKPNVQRDQLSPAGSPSSSCLDGAQSFSNNNKLQVCSSSFNQSIRSTGKPRRNQSKVDKLKSSRAHVCLQCGRSFSRSDMLTRHTRLHSGLKPYQCSECKQVFSRSDHLSTHERTHTGEKPYRCSQCPYSACRRDMITRHMRTHLGSSRATPTHLGPGRPADVGTKMSSTGWSARYRKKCSK